MGRARWARRWRRAARKVLKPAEQTALSALAMARNWQWSGLPRRSELGDRMDGPAAIGSSFSRTCRVRHVSFTGSTEVGKLLIRQSRTTW